MSIQSNFPNIKPTLNLDFANVKQLDPRITFTRASTGTYYDGKTVAKAEENLLIRSQDYSATWTVTTLTPVTGKTAPDTTSSATEFTATAANAVLTQGFTAVAGSYTFSVFLRRVTGSGDIQIAADNGTWTTKTITGSWARYDVTQTVTAGARTAGVRVVTDTDVIEVWGAQLEQRSSVTAYTATTTQPITNYIPVLQTAAAGVARFDHNPTTDESLGLLVEEQRTNLVLQSEDLSTTWISNANTTIDTNVLVSPAGTLTVDRLRELTTNAQHPRNQAVTIAANTTHTASVYVKAGERTGIWLQLANSAFINSFRVVVTGLNTATPTTQNLTGGTGTVASSSVVSVGNGWFRVSVTGMVDASSTDARFGVYLLNGAGSDSYTGDGYSGIYIWGAQLEAGAFPTSYIPTVASQVTRSADAASMTGTNFSSWYAADQGTFYTEALIPFTIADNRGPVRIDDGSENNRIMMRNGGSNSRLDGRVITSGSSVANLESANTTITAGTMFKAALAFKTDDFAMSRNGGTVVTDTGGNVPVVNRLLLGDTMTSTTVRGSTIRKIAYYPMRVADAQLQALTS